MSIPENESYLKKEIEKRTNELNQMRLQKERARFRIMLDNLSSKKQYLLTQDIENAFKIKMKIKKHFWIFKEAIYFTNNENENNFGLWILKIDKFGIKYNSYKNYTNELVKKEIKMLMKIAEKYNNEDKYLGISGLDGLKVPEIEDSGFHLIYI